jgi:hypothetical protein
MIGLISRSIVNPHKRGGKDLGSRFTYLFCNTPLWLIVWIPIIILAVCLYAQTGRGAQEPLAFLSGLSIWPTEMIRLIAIMLAIQFMIKASLTLKENEYEIADHYCLGSLPATRWSCSEFWQHLKPWQSTYSDWLKPGAKFDAKDAWNAYLSRNRFSLRFLRVSLLWLVYLVFLIAVTKLFKGRLPDAPARGPTAITFNLWVGVSASICWIVLSFYVVDAIQLNGNFIRVFTRGLTKWEPKVSLRSGRVPPLTDADLSRYHDVFFVAKRTEEVARLVWYPLVILAILVVGRSSLFDNWTWPSALIVVFALNGIWAVGSAVFLRRVAEQLRDVATENLQLERLRNYADQVRRETFDELIGEIRSLKKGAFAPLSEQPFIRAILLPGGGLGLLAVGQRLLEGF